MSRTFITTIAAASIALTSLGATPVQAQDRNYDLERTLAAILGVAIVGKVIHDKKKRDERAHQHTPRHAKPVQKTHRVEPRPLPRKVERQRQREQEIRQQRRANKRLLPRECFRTFRTTRGKYRGFSNRCLQNNFRHAHRLPQYCKTRIRTNQGPRRVYEARCLRDAGYRLARG